jgi:hypothetical protein
MTAAMTHDAIERWRLPGGRNEFNIEEASGSYFNASGSAAGVSPPSDQLP